MRTCFVPWCDSLCKRQQKRMMFLPPKNKELFEMWKEVLPKKKTLRPTDKICERHFKKEDIITTFDHIINGQLFQMERGRPKLKPNAVPSHNLPTDDEEQLFVRLRRGRISKIVKLEVQQLSNKEINQREDSPDKEDDEISELAADISSASDEKKDSDDTSLVLNETLQASYDILYDDIFEVILPSTLWGIHRDPDRTFVAFSFFDNQILRTTKLIVLDCKGLLQIFIHSKLVNEQALKTELTHELLSNIISQVDEAKICKKAVDNNDCEVKVVEGSEYCNNCS